MSCRRVRGVLLALVVTLGVAGFALKAEVRPVAPADGAVVSQLRPVQAKYASESWSDCRRFFDGGELAKSLKADGCHPAAIRLVWSGGTAPYVVVVQRLPDGRLFLTTETERCEASVDSLEIAREWEWSVTDATGARVTRRFWTEDRAPRLVRIEGVPNVRDLGGRIGLNGRRVRQGLLFRSAGLNNNATGTEKDGNQVAGTKRLTDEELSRIKGLYGFRSDIDLRRPDEVFGMSGSPLGPDVRWINLRYATYETLTNAVSRKRATEIYREIFNTNNYPVVFHCIAGADRTGTLAYVLNGLLGVPEDEALKDYLATALVDHGVADLSHLRHVDAMVGAMRTFPGETFESRMSAYVRSLGFAQTDIDRFREFLLEPSPGGTR